MKKERKETQAWIDNSKSFEGIFMIATLFKWKLSVAISVESLYCEKLEDIQMILQLSECLSATNICEQNMFSTCDFILMQHNSHSDKVTLYARSFGRRFFVYHHAVNHPYTNIILS